MSLPSHHPWVPDSDEAIFLQSCMRERLELTWLVKVMANSPRAKITDRQSLPDFISVVAQVQHPNAGRSFGHLAVFGALDDLPDL